MIKISNLKYTEVFHIHGSTIISMELSTKTLTTVTSIFNCKICNKGVARAWQYPITTPRPLNRAYLVERALAVLSAPDIRELK